MVPSSLKIILNYSKFLLLMGAWFGLSGWAPPGLPGAQMPLAPVPEQLREFVVAVNGQPQVLAAGATLSLIAGDTFKIIEGRDRQGRRAKAMINFVGYTNPQGVPGHDLGYNISTERELLRGWSSRKQGEIYAIKATHQGQALGHAYVQVSKPQLKFAEMALAGRVQVVRPGDRLTVSSSDELKVQRVETNFATADDVEIKPVRASGDLYQLQFFRKGKRFAALDFQISSGGAQAN